MHVGRMEKEGKTNFGSTGATVDLTPYDVGIQGMLGTINGAMESVRILQYLTNFLTYQRQLRDGWINQETFDRYMSGYAHEKQLVAALGAAQQEELKRKEAAIAARQALYQQLNVGSTEEDVVDFIEFLAGKEKNDKVLLEKVSRAYPNIASREEVVRKWIELVRINMEKNPK